MAVRIPIYTQQTATPTARVTGGNPMAVGGPDVSGAFNALARGGAAIYTQRKQEEEGLASAWAADSLAQVQREAPRKMDELKQTAGEGGAGVVDGMNAWMEERTSQLLEAAPTDSSKDFLRRQLTDYRTRVDLGAYEYEQTERIGYTAGKFDSSIESGAAAAAANPGMAPTIIAQIRSAIQANPILSPEAKRSKEEALIQTVSYADVLGELKRDPYAARNHLRKRIGIAPDATPNEVALQMESAMALLDEVEAQEGFTVPADQRSQAVAHLMAGGNIAVKDGQVVATGQGSGEASNVPLTYGALAVPKVIELLSRADAKIAEIEKAKNQNANFGRLLFSQQISDKLAAAQAGEPITIPPYEQMARFLGEERAMIVQEQLQVAQTMQGELVAMSGMTNEGLAAVVASVPVGTVNRQFRDQAYAVKVQRVNAIMAQRKDDPGGYVLQNSQPVQQAYARVSALQEGLGPQSTPDDIAAFQQAQTQYVQASTAEQQRLGILEPKLPKAYIGAVTQRFSEGMAGDGATQAAAEMEGLAMNLIGAPSAIEQIQKETGLTGAMAIDGVPGMVIKRIQNMSQMSEAKMKELLPAGIVWGQVEKAVADAFVPLDTTLGRQGDPVTASRYRTAGQLLAVDYLHSGRAASAKDAAKMAYDKLFAERNAVKGTYRVPLNLPTEGRIVAIDPDAVESGLISFMDNITPDMMQFPVDPGFTAEESFKRNIRTVRQRSYWANNQTGTGVILMGPDGPQRDPNGVPIEVSFTRAIELANDPEARRAQTARQVQDVLKSGVK